MGLYLSVGRSISSDREGNVLARPLFWHHSGRKQRTCFGVGSSLDFCRRSWWRQYLSLVLSSGMKQKSCHIIFCYHVMFCSLLSPFCMFPLKTCLEHFIFCIAIYKLVPFSCQMLRFLSHPRNSPACWSRTPNDGRCMPPSWLLSRSSCVASRHQSAIAPVVKGKGKLYLLCMSITGSGICFVRQLWISTCSLTMMILSRSLKQLHVSSKAAPSYHAH